MSGSLGQIEPIRDLPKPQGVLGWLAAYEAGILTCANLKRALPGDRDSTAETVLNSLRRLAAAGP